MSESTPEPHLPPQLSDGPPPAPSGDPAPRGDGASAEAAVATATESGTSPGSRAAAGSVAGDASCRLDAEGAGERPCEGGPSPRALLIVGLVASALLAGLVAHWNFLIDDAFISFRYARNWVAWGLPAYNPGEVPPVEGYSNLLWVLLLALGERLGCAPETCSRALSIAAAFTTLWLALRVLGRRYALPLVPTAVGALALATMPPFAVWATGGLETALFTLCLFGAFVALDAEVDERGERVRRAGAILAGAGLVLTRPEGVAWLVGLALVAALAARLARRPVPRARLLLYLGASLAVFAASLAWRRATHGAWLPNTVSAKAGLNGAVLERGARNLASWALTFWTPLVALAALPLGGRRRKSGIALVALIVAGALYDLFVGGDWMPMYRFLAPLSPFVALAFALVCARVSRLVGLRVGAAIGGLLGATGIAVALAAGFGHTLVPRAHLEALYFRAFKKGYESEAERWQSSVDNARSFEVIGRGLAPLADGRRSITLGAIGAIGYYSGLVVHDRNGLVDREVASLPATPGEGTAGHDRRVPRAFFAEREPTWYEAILWSGLIEDERDPAFAQAALAIGRRIAADGESSLLASCLPRVFPIEASEHVPPNTTLVVLERAPGREREARALWRQLGLLR